jgi:D-alanyl-D-alanine carboxypeptidase
VSIIEKKKTLIIPRSAPKGRGLQLLALLLLTFSFFTPSNAQARYASVVMDAQTGRILHQENAQTRNYPASLTKMMTLYLAFESLERGRFYLHQPLRTSRQAARQPASKLGLSRGDTITMEQAILAIVTKSANDAAKVVAEALGGSERNFALLMTAKARRLGMGRTTFRNASGLPHRGQLSTAMDMANLARRLIIDFPNYYHYFSTRSFSYNGVVHKNHNRLLDSYEGVDGIKTGYIRASGFNLVASAKRNGRRLIGVVFGGRSARTRNLHMSSLLDKGFRKVGPPSTIRIAKAPPRSNRQRSTPKGKSGQGWGIQVGAYRSFSPAFDIAQKALETAPKHLERGRIAVIPLRRSRGSGFLYRARIVGISKTQAFRACNVLARKRMDCLEMKSKKGPQLAANEY